MEQIPTSNESIGGTSLLDSLHSLPHLPMVYGYKNIDRSEDDVDIDDDDTLKDFTVGEILQGQEECMSDVDVSGSFGSQMSLFG
jgi:hypothetical protein